MNAADFATWRDRMNLSKTAAAEALGLSRNMPAKYEAGAPVPLYVALACEALEQRAGIVQPKPEPADQVQRAEMVTENGVAIGLAVDGDGIWFHAEGPVAFEPNALNEGWLRLRRRIPVEPAPLRARPR